jgi:hypothetical protein
MYNSKFIIQNLFKSKIHNPESKIEKTEGNDHRRYSAGDNPTFSSTGEA